MTHIVLTCTHLTAAFDPFPQREVDDGEYGQQTKGHLPTHGAHVVESIGKLDLKHAITREWILDAVKLLKLWEKKITL